MEAIKKQAQEIADSYFPNKDQKANNTELVNKIVALCGKKSTVTKKA
ncbi:MAG: hypothetical protein AAFY41_07090 [Bacteroidota bacterium]